MQPGEVRRVIRDSRHIDGWFSPAAAGLFGLVDEAQKRAGIGGDLFEIGVHHGKSAVLLGHMALPTERVRVCDVFLRQDLNMSVSGAGNRGRFERNMARVAPAAKYDVFEQSSLELSADQIGHRPHRFFHIDGGHSMGEALSDLLLASSVLRRDGIIAIDDPFRHEWPGVTEAIFEFCRTTEYVPFTIGFNKLLLATGEARAIYDAALNTREWDFIDRIVYSRKNAEVLGSQAAIYFIPSYRQLPPAADGSVARVRRVGNAASAVLRRYAR